MYTVAFAVIQQQCLQHVGLAALLLPRGSLQQCLEFWAHLEADRNCFFECYASDGQGPCKSMT